MARAALNWTLNDLGARASVNKNTISKYEAGGSVMSDALQRIEKVIREEGVQFIDDATELGLIVQVPPMFTSVKSANKVSKEKSGLRKVNLKKRSQKSS